MVALEPPADTERYFEDAVPNKQCLPASCCLPNIGKQLVRPAWISSIEILCARIASFGDVGDVCKTLFLLLIANDM